MKVVMGPLEMIFNETKSPILEETLKIVDDYRKNISELNNWLNGELAKTKNEYEKRQSKLVRDAETQLIKYAGEVAK